MPEDWLSVAEAADRLGVSRRRVQAYVSRGTLPSKVVGGVHLVALSDVEQLRRTRPSGPGAPLTEEGAWRRIAAVANGDVQLRSRTDLDGFRRAVRTRAEHQKLYVHPSLLAEVANWPGFVHGGRTAAAAAEVAVDPADGKLEAYLRRTAAIEATDQVRARIVDEIDGANTLLHVVSDQCWPFSPTASVVPLWVAWLDLADLGDRAADTVLDRLLGGRLVG